MAPVVSNVTVSKLATRSVSRIKNSQPPGIGRLSAMHGFLVINNLGRNIEISVPLGDSLVANHVYERTAFPDQDEPSQFDLDYHGFLCRPDQRQLIAVNHFGIVRLLAPTGTRSAFSPRLNEEQLELTSERNLKWPGDAERFLFVGSSLVSSSPRGYGVDDGIEPGILISEDWDHAVNDSATNSGTNIGEVAAHQIRYQCALADLGIVTAIASSECGQFLAVAADTRLVVFRMKADPTAAMDFQNRIWEKEVDCTVSWLHFSEDTHDLLVGGCAPSDRLDDGADWESLKGGALGALDRNTGQEKWLSTLTADLAWGNGGDPLAYIPQRKLIAGVDRTGGLMVWNAAEGDSAVAARSQSDASMGIAHAACLGDSLYCGFNRGGYFLFRYEL